MRHLGPTLAALLLATGLVRAPAVVRADAGPDGGWDGGPAEEVCNGVDDDTDGQTDTPYGLCPDGICFHGQCLEYCYGGELLCPEGKTCVEIMDEWVCIPDVCNELNEDHLACTDNPYCCSFGFEPPCACEAVEQKCVDYCFGIACPDGYVCVVAAGGQCHPEADADCYVASCPAGQICVDGECAEDPCDGVECEHPRYCNGDGECVFPCWDFTCPDGVGCYEGECVEDPCAGVLCEPGLSCVDGLCVQGACWGVECEFYQVCSGGECVHDPCWNIECPNCRMCVDGACYDYAEPTGMLEADPDPEPLQVDDTDDGLDTDTGPVNGMTSVLATGAGGCKCRASTGHPSIGLVGIVVGSLVD
jgi:hypothetical protein